MRIENWDAYNASIQTLKQGNEKCGKDDVFELVKDSLDEKIARETFEELLESLIQSQSIKPNAFGDGECLSWYWDGFQIPSAVIEITVSCQWKPTENFLWSVRKKSIYNKEASDKVLTHWNFSIR